MPFCVNEPVIKDWPDCCIFDVCFDCGLTMPSDQSMAKDFTWGSYFIVTILFSVGIWNIAAFYRVYKDNNNYISLMRIANTLYAIGTGIFGFCRIHYQLGKPLLVFASIHNLCEWVFVAYAFYQNRKQREYAIFGSICWIFLIIGLILVILTEFPYFALAEQTTGISLDFMLPFIWFILWRQNKTGDHEDQSSNEKPKAEEEKTTYSIADIYLISFVAHLVHILFTILPLVIVNFIRDQNALLSRMMEFAIFISVPVTHILYTKVTDLHEEMIDLPSNKSSTDYPDKYVMQISPLVCCGNDTKPFIRMLFWYILCIIIGLFPTVLIPAILPKCNGSTSGSAGSPEIIEADKFMIGTSIGYVYPGMGEAFESYIYEKNLIENARNYDGNIFYYFNKDLTTPNRYFFVEAWESKEAVFKFIQSDYDRQVFGAEYIKEMLINGTLETNGYLPLTSKYLEQKQDENKTLKTAKGAMRHVFKGFNGCEDWGEEIIKLDSCDWIMGCDHIEVINEEKGEQKMVFENGFALNCLALNLSKDINETDNTIHYKMIHQCDNGITEYYNLIYDPDEYGQDSCYCLLPFDVDSQGKFKSVDEVYKQYKTMNLPFIQHKYQVTTPDKCAYKTAGSNSSQGYCRAE